LTDGLEVAGVLVLREAVQADEVLGLAGGVAAAAGSPWGKVFPQAGQAPASDGHFDGLRAVASVEGTRYRLGPVEDVAAVPEAFRQRHRGTYLLRLAQEQDGQAVGIVALRPRLGVGVPELVEACRRHRVRVELLPLGDRDAAEA